MGDVHLAGNFCPQKHKEFAMSAGTVPAPGSLQELGVGRRIVEDLALKIVYLTGEISVQNLAERMKITRTLADELVSRLRRDHFCEVTGLTGTVHRVQVTAGGRTRALQLLELSQYAGPAPVSFEDYVAMVRWQRIRRMEVRPEDMQRVFQHLVVTESMLSQLGAAVTSGRALFLYGPSGTGKTIMAEHLAEVFRRESIWIPYAVEVAGQIITIFDAHVHERSDQPIPENVDARWVLCRRPKVIVGGELSEAMLDLQYNPQYRYYSAPAHLKANNGVLIIDDFGRQRVRPAELLNRWVVPLDRQIDFLSLVGGDKIEVPFDVFVVFASNMDVGELVDEAFLRRVQTKIRVDYVTREQFHRIFANNCRELKLEYRPAQVNYLIDFIQGGIREPLRACHPRDILNQICWAATYRGSTPTLEKETVDDACRRYFVSRGNGAPGSPGNSKCQAASTSQP
jgi:predicted ATPase with chaperone activity